MKTLDTNLRRHGFRLSQVWREGNLAIYRQHIDGKNDRFEVVTIREQQARSFTDKTGKVNSFGASEVYPSDTDWGTRAWTEWTFEAARARIQRLHAAKREHKEAIK